MRIFVLTATYELRGSRKIHLRDHPTSDSTNSYAVNLAVPKTRSHKGIAPKWLDKG